MIYFKTSDCPILQRCLNTQIEPYSYVILLCSYISFQLHLASRKHLKRKGIAPLLLETMGEIVLKTPPRLKTKKCN
ncbi:unnamed protein product [Larinioides sclopetarius]|uniref:Uncharacterized protein n=1 Tax=Larinioides sclopetarius TaxID=280406 RepID=A0AAV1YYA3_9ARAC